MTPSVTLVRAFDRSWAAWLHGLRMCRQKPSRKRVHALRVECRRLDALIDVLSHTADARPKAVKRLRKIVAQPLDALSTLRDDQVQRRRIEKTTGGSGLDGLRDDVERRHVRHRKRARRALRAIDVTRANVAAGRIRHSLVRRQDTRTPAERAERLAAAVTQAAAGFDRRRARIDLARPRTLHRLRVAGKRFRYVVDIVAAIAPHVDIPARPDLGVLQRELGHVHDGELLAGRIVRLLQRRRTPHKKALRVFKASLAAERVRALRVLARELPPLRLVPPRAAARRIRGRKGAV